VLSAPELHKRGLTQSNAGQYQKARSTFRHALDRASDVVTRARVLLSLAHVESELGMLADGIELCRRALSLTDLPTDVQGMIHGQLGLLYMRAGDGDLALAEFGQGLKLLDRESSETTRILLHRALVHQQRGETRLAFLDYESAAAAADRAGEVELLAKIRHNMGETHLLVGDLVTALQLMDAARPILAPLSRSYRAICEQHRAEVLTGAGMVDEASLSLRQAIADFGALGLRQNQAEAEFALTRLLLPEHAAEAGRIARRAQRRFERRGSHVWALRAEVVSLASDVETKRVRTTQIRRRATALEEELRAVGLHFEARAVALQSARAAVLGNDLGSAEARLREISTPRTAMLPTRLLDRQVRSELAAARGHRGRALQHVRRGLADLHTWQSSFGSLDLQSSVAGHGQALALQGLSLAVADGRPEVVFEWSERARALASRVSPVRPPRDDEAAADLGELRRLQTVLSEDIGALQSHGGMVREVARLRQRIRQRAWYQPGPGEVTEPVSLEAARSVLDSTDGAMVAYVYADAVIHALAVTGEDVQLVRLADYPILRGLLDGMQADLDTSAATLPTSMRQVVRAGLEHRLDELASVLVEPLLPLLGNRPIVIVPANALAGIPWTLLPGYAQRPLALPRSASSWIATRAGEVLPRAAGFVAGPRVSRADEEVHKSASQWPRAAVLSGDEAVAERVTALAGQVDVLHSATHGRHSADNPLFSGLELADGPWFGYDIAQLERIPSTVVLSACELGRSTLRWGDETLGMTVAWLHAGARCVIASPALVNDDVACDVLTTTHQRLAQGQQPSYALADAVTAVGGAMGSEAPVPFICFGAGW
jgi:tetratricopeptide (TPR) repeat protein